MSLTKNLNAIILSTLLLFTSTVFAVEPLPDNLTKFDGVIGTALLKKNAQLNTSHLLAHFTTQDTQTYCGVASAVMVLNAAIVHDAPIDPIYDPYNYFTQDNFFTDAVTDIITPEEVLAAGMTLQQMADAIDTFDGVFVEHFHASDISLTEFRLIAKTALANNQYVTVNFLRTAAGFETGGGHHSPVAAYNKETDQFLILDVARYRYPSFWISAEDLWNSINTTDNDAGKSRGFIVIAKQ